jgi:predicted metalloprotease
MSPVRPGHPPGMRRAAVVAVLATCVVPLTGCVVSIDGLPSALEPPVSDVGDGEVRIVGADDGPIDELARNALADLERFWSEQLPEVYGQQFRPLEGGYFSVDPGNVDRSVYPDGVSCGASPLEVQGNAFYCQAAGEANSDSISYDRAFLGKLADDFGDFIPDLVMAHEFGHAIQGRVGFPGASIVAETQADCFAGAWTAWVAAGEAQHTTVRPPELDEVLGGYLQLRDPVGTSLQEESAHGSYFDRVSAFQEGFSDGVVACRDNFTAERVFTQQGFRAEDLQTGGNAPGNSAFDQLLVDDGAGELVELSLPPFWDAVFSSLGAGGFDAPDVEPFEGTAPGCAPDDRDLVYCPEDNLVGFDVADLGEEAYEIGDFAVITGVSIPYALSARDQLGLSTDDTDAVESAVCSTGAFSFAVFNREVRGVAISPGDIDESVVFLLRYGTDPQVLPDVDLTGFQLVNVFRNGFVRGLEACDLA